jgi:hypothetical protein
VGTNNSGVAISGLSYIVARQNSTRVQTRLGSGFRFQSGRALDKKRGNVPSVPRFLSPGFPRFPVSSPGDSVAWLEWLYGMEDPRL